MKKYRNYIIMLLGVLLFIGACGMPNDNAETEENINESNQLQVVTSIFPVYEITKTIAGSQADVSLMVGANEDAHHYEPSAQAIAAVNQADIFIYSSHVMEFWVDSMLEVVENDDLIIIEMAEGLDLTLAETHTAETDNHETDGHDHDHDHGGQDPHFWLDPVAVNNQLPVISEALQQIDPENADMYAENTAAFSEELFALDQAYDESLADAANNVFVVQHQAFGHLANRYDLNQVAVGGLTTEIEPSPQKMAEIIEFVKAQEVPVVYYQSGESSAVAETIARETGTNIAVLHDLEGQPMGIETADNLYLEAMYENLEQLEKSIN